MPKRNTAKSKKIAKQAYRSKQLTRADERETDAWLNELPGPDPDTPSELRAPDNQFEALPGVPTPVLHHMVKVPGAFILTDEFAQISQQAIDILSECLIRTTVRTHIEVPGHVINLTFVPSVVVNKDGGLHLIKSALYDYQEDEADGPDKNGPPLNNHRHVAWMHPKPMALYKRCRSECERSGFGEHGMANSNGSSICSRTRLFNARTPRRVRVRRMPNQFRYTAHPARRKF